MSETLRDLVVSLSLNSDNFTRNIKSIQAYQGQISMNGCVSGDFPRLLPGMNAISWSGSVSRVVIQPNWRYL